MQAIRPGPIFAERRGPVEYRFSRRPDGAITESPVHLAMARPGSDPPATWDLDDDMIESELAYTIGGVPLKLHGTHIRKSFRGLQAAVESLCGPPWVEARDWDGYPGVEEPPGSGTINYAIPYLTLSRMYELIHLPEEGWTRRRPLEFRHLYPCTWFMPHFETVGLEITVFVPPVERRPSPMNHTRPCTSKTLVKGVGLSRSAAEGQPNVTTVSGAGGR